MRMLAVFACLLLEALCPADAQACSIVLPRHPPTQLEIDARREASYRRAASVVEVVALGASIPGQGGQVRVTRVYKGRLRPGAVLHFDTLADNLCGAGEFEAGSRGILLLPARGPFMYEGYLPRDAVTTLRLAGLLPFN